MSSTIIAIDDEPLALLLVESGSYRDLLLGWHENKEAIVFESK